MGTFTLAGFKHGRKYYKQDKEFVVKGKNTHKRMIGHSF
jgi:hypothetical protein